MTSMSAEELAADRGIDVNDPMLPLKVAAERLSIVRYVFLVQVEGGIASAAQRASLEYSDAVLIGWPDADSPEVIRIEEDQYHAVREYMQVMEQYIASFSRMEREGDADGMTDTLIRITERVAEVRRMYQPDSLCRPLLRSAGSFRKNGMRIWAKSTRRKTIPPQNRSRKRPRMPRLNPRSPNE
ncbi:phosphoribosylformylglycinamidine (FGAM) synthase, synthetase domain protein [Bifidobacterium tsurumiense]|uniref:Phosphoribosylformylglycinamidine (FGAM) synthase, synthetase domain protein n=1 Tax=Bifidobacterium tsurumiense TaxID=356829 RepID=A0A087EDZ1_9BIFI|nr:phosphoribosylformylglycinamidine (FGAM) synthase, synthetase domain protein [Bifidobacterium tsurumiense]